MKVVCETCEAKYQIPDERVAGRRLRIRCRKCGGVMEARGDELPSQAAPAATIEWFASVDGTPIGPLTTDEIVSRISTGVLEWDAHIWREGYAEWKTVDAADTLVRAVASSRGAINDERPDSTERTSLPPNGARDDDDEYERDARTMNVDAPTIAALEDSPTRIAFDETPTRMYSGHSAPAGSLQPVARSAFASRPPGHIAPVARPVISESSPNLMASGQGAYGSSPSLGNSPSYGNAPTIEIARNHLTGGPLPIPTSASRAPASVAPVRPGFAGGEGSGLIDIRALASLAQTRMNAPQQPQRSIPPAYAASAELESDEIENDPLASFGTGHGVAFAALDSLAPVANREKPKDKTVPLAILVGFAMVAAAAFAAVYITRAPVPAPQVATAAQPPAPAAALEPVAPVAAAEPAAPAAAAAEPVAPAEPAAAAAAEPEEKAKAAAPAAEEPEVAAAPIKGTVARGAKRKGARKPAHEGAAAADAPEGDEEEDDLLAKTEEKKAPPPSVDDILLADDKPAEKAEKAPEEKPAAKQPAADRSIDDLLDTAVAKKGSAAAAPAAATGGAEAPSRADVLAAMRKIEGEVRACAANEATPVSGTANVAITVVGSTGKVTNAEVSGLTGPVGSCIARVARTATFAPFTRDKFSVTYPYRFK